MLRADELSLLAKELETRLLEARVGKVYELSPARVLLRLKPRDGEDLALLIALDGAHLRCVLLDERPETPRKPSPVAELLRRELSGARVTRVHTLPADRVLFVDLSVIRGGEKTERRLAIELFKASRNLYCLDEKGIIRTVLRSTSGERDLAVGSVYEPPVPPAMPHKADAAPPFSFLSTPPEDGRICSALEAYAAPKETLDDRDALTRTAKKELAKRKKRTERLLLKLVTDHEDAERALEHRRQGELLKANFGILKKGLLKVTVTDWSAPEQPSVEVALDPTLTPNENIQKLFDRAKKLDRAGPQLLARIDEARTQLAAITSTEAALLAASTEGEIRGVIERSLGKAFLAQKPAAGGPSRAAQAEVEPKKPYRLFLAADGWELLVGRTAVDNDELTFRVAKGNDYWFHVAGTPGSHVVARGPGEIKSETLVDAATLAAIYSKAKNQAKVEVSYTQKKNVQKFKGARPGQVMMASRKTMLVRVDDVRVETIKGRRGRPGTMLGD